MAAIDDNKLLTFDDLVFLVTNMGYYINGTLNPSNECATKSEIIAAIHITVNVEYERGKFYEKEARLLISL